MLAMYNEAKSASKNIKWLVKQLEKIAQKDAKAGGEDAAADE
jgi:hypothetical protein